MGSFGRCASLIGAGAILWCFQALAFLPLQHDKDSIGITTSTRCIATIGRDDRLGEEQE